MRKGFFRLVGLFFGGIVRLRGYDVGFVVVSVGIMFWFLVLGRYSFIF